MKTTSRRIAEILASHIGGQDGISVAAVADWMGVCIRTVQRWLAHETRLTAGELLDLVGACQQEDPVKAAALWRDISALVHQESRPAPKTVAASSLEDGCLAVAAEAGDVSAALRRAVDPAGPGGREILASEAAEIALEARDVELAAMAARAAARGVPSPQLSLGGAL